MTQPVPKPKLKEIEALLQEERDLRTKAEADRQAAIDKLKTRSKWGISAQIARLDAEGKHQSELSLRTAAEKSLADAENALADERNLRIQAEKGLLDIKVALEGDRQLRIEAEQKLAGVREELHHERRSRASAEQNLAGMKDEWATSVSCAPRPKTV
ncbi:hypothetical protein BD779DRAFT_125916 [Infundibulicybe gibba]|nr:hypothetical protein BD779DRAFT_125916 [Infundibulicybe gibba]